MEAEVSSFERGKLHCFGSESMNKHGYTHSTRCGHLCQHGLCEVGRGRMVTETQEESEEKTEENGRQHKAGRTNGGTGMKQAPLPQTTTELISPLALRREEYLCF